MDVSVTIVDVLLVLDSCSPWQTCCSRVPAVPALPSPKKKTVSLYTQENGASTSKSRDPERPT